MAQRRKEFRGYSFVRFDALGDLSLRTVETPASPLAANGGDALIGPVFRVFVGLCMADARLTRRVAGASGTTTAELWRRRAGVWELVSTLAVASGSGDLAEAVESFPTLSTNKRFRVGDLIAARLVSVEGGSPQDLSVIVETR
jgi:exosome complex RNA-binding protein Csl4